ncbi:MAG TPA: M48 family metallopeptidase [Cellvibrionaceae bacterium]
MQVIEGVWYESGQSRGVAAVLRVDDVGNLRMLAMADNIQLARADATQIRVSSRLANTPRFITLPCGGTLESAQNDDIDALLKTWQPTWYQGWIHRLESHLPFVLVTVVLVMAFAWAMVMHGLPAGARYMAHALPAETLNTVSKETMALLDRMYLAPSELSGEQQAELQAAFAPVLDEYSEMPLRVLFRKGGERIGANAFALPDGTMVFTDEIVALADSHHELIAVLAHEIGHIHHRHSLRAMIQNATLGIAYMMLVGDASAVGEVLLSLPVIMATLAYSRENELEADRFSAEYLDRHNIDRKAFVNILARMGKSAHCQELISDDDENREATENMTQSELLVYCEKLMAEQEEDDSIIFHHYLSTHPGMEQRLEIYMQGE